MPFAHGVSVQELDTAVVGVNEAPSAIPFVVGTAPVHNLADGVTQPVNVVKKITSLAEYFETFGEVVTGESESDFSLTRAARVLLGAYRVQPVYMVNVFDPATHVDLSDEPDVSTVAAADLVGGCDAGTRTGFELIETVFPEFGQVPSILLAPDWSHEATVAAEMISKAESISDLFKAMAYIDVDPAETTPADAITWKATYSSAHAVIHYPRVTSDGVSTSLALHAAGLTAKTDVAAGGIPYESPSNKDLLISGPVTILTIPEATSLNAAGITTAFRFTGGWKLWGNRTAAFPGVTDLRDSFVSARRVANWIEQTLILLVWQKVDKPTNLRLIDSVVSTINIWLNGLAGAGALLGAKVYFRKEDNPKTDLAAGRIKFYVRYLAPLPAEDITFVLEVDTSYFDALA